MIRILPFLHSPKDLDLSYKTDLDFWHWFGRKKSLLLITEEVRFLAMKGADLSKSCPKMIPAFT